MNHIKGKVNESAIKYLEFVNRENDDRHHTNEEDMYQYELLKAGDMRVKDECERIIRSGLPGHLSNDPLRNMKYLFVCSATLACRAAMSAGLDAETCYNISDLYIQKMDLLNSIEDVLSLRTEMFVFYTKKVSALPKKTVYSRPIEICIDYIYIHQHEPIHLDDLAALTGLNASYLSTLFKKETGLTVSKYILSKKMEEARNLLTYSEYSYSEIASILAFSSQSHFTKVFKTETGYTPREYRNIKNKGWNVMKK